MRKDRLFFGDPRLKEFHQIHGISLPHQKVVDAVSRCPENLRRIRLSNRLPGFLPM